MMEDTRRLTAREEVWLRAWAQVAGTFNAKLPDCTRYADSCLKDFDGRFPRQTEEPA